MIIFFKKIIKQLDVILGNEKNDFLRYFCMGLKSHLSNDAEATIEIFNTALSKVSSVDKYNNFKLGDYKSILAYVDKNNDWNKLKGFSGNDIISIIKSITISLQTDSTATVKSTETAKVEQAGSGKKARSAETKETSKFSDLTPRLLIEEINDLLKGVSQNLSNLMNGISNEKNLEKTIMHLRNNVHLSFADFTDHIKNITNIINKELDPKCEQVKEFSELYNKLATITNNTIEKPLVLPTNTMILKNVLYEKSLFGDLNVIPGKEHFRYLKISPDNFKIEDSPFNFLEAVYIYLRSYYQNEIKTLYIDKKHLFKRSERKQLENIIFGTDNNALDNNDNAQLSHPNPEILNINASRSKLGKIIFGNFSVLRGLSNIQLKQLYYMNKYFNIPNDKVEKGLPKYLRATGILSSLFLSSLLTFVIMFGGNGGGGGEEADQKVIADKTVYVPNPENKPIVKEEPPIQPKKSPIKIEYEFIKKPVTVMKKVPYTETIEEPDYKIVDYGIDELSGKRITEKKQIGTKTKTITKYKYVPVEEIQTIKVPKK